MLHIRSPAQFISERTYITSVFFREFLGLSFTLSYEDRVDTLITDNNGRTLRIVDGLFSTPEPKWLTLESLPTRPLRQWNARQTQLQPDLLVGTLPIIYGRNPDAPDFFSVTGKEISLGLDVFGSAFFVLTRYEEAVSLDRDDHRRFPAAAGIAFGEGFLDRPIVNEYLEVLWSALRLLWPGLKRRPRTKRVVVSHDVDAPLADGFRPAKEVWRDAIWLGLKGRQPAAATMLLRTPIEARWRRSPRDPYNCFDKLMDIEERHGLRSAFYFLADSTAKSFDGQYQLHHPFIKRLLQRIHERGHEIGLHPSYNTFRDSTQLKYEFAKLRSVCQRLRIEQTEWGGRQHYLRWECPTTFQTWEDAGLSYDSTLGFADRVGFRCGVCYEYPVFNVRTRQALKLRERPLIVMDASVFGARYMNIPIDDVRALDLMLEMKKRCHHFGGDFTLLWHNSQFPSAAAFSLFEEVIGT